MENIIVERAELKDLGEVENLYNAVCDYLADKEFNPGWRRDCFPTRNEALYYMEDDGLFVARENGRIVGTVGLTHRPNGESDEAFRGDETIYPDQLFVHVLAVHPEHFRKGIATALLQFAEALGREEKVRVLKLDVYEKNTVAIRTYEKNGFVYVGKEDIGLGDLGMNWFYLYEKAIR